LVKTREGREEVKNEDAPQRREEYERRKRKHKKKRTRNGGAC